jgi:hypothetical protein
VQNHISVLKRFDDFYKRVAAENIDIETFLLSAEFRYRCYLSLLETVVNQSESGLAPDLMPLPPW